MICARPDCPLERLSRAIQESKGTGHARYDATATYTCALCQQNKTWVIKQDGQTREVSVTPQ